MSTSKKQPPNPTRPAPVRAAPANPIPIAAQQQTDDVLLDAPPRSVIIGDDGTVDAATAGTQPLKAQSIKDGFTAAAATMGDNLEGGSPGLPRDPVAFPLAFRIVGQLVSVFAGFHTFMNAVKRPQDSVLVPAAAAA